MFSVTSPVFFPVEIYIWYLSTRLDNSYLDICCKLCLSYVELISVPTLVHRRLDVQSLTLQMYLGNEIFLRIKRSPHMFIQEQYVKGDVGRENAGKKVG